MPAVINDVKDSILGLIKEYFYQTIDIYWINQDQAQSKIPCLTLDLSEVSQTELPIESIGLDEEERYYRSTATLTVNLYTMYGRDIYSGHIRDALNDCKGLMMFLKSYRVFDWEKINNITFANFKGPIQVPGLYGKASFEYRAMFQAEVRFISTTSNYTNVTEINGSGGGTPEQISQKVGSFVSVEIKKGY